MQTSKSIQRLEGRMAVLEPGTVRYETLEAAKRFKSSWVELGRMLWTVWSQKKYREWEYLTFEAYCTREVGIKPATAKKLLHSYYFLEKEEPTLLKRMAADPPAALPSAEAVNLVRLLRKKQEVAPAAYQKIRSYALEAGKEPSALRREVRSILEAAHPDPEAAREAKRTATLRRMVGTLKAIRLECAASHLLPKKLITEIESLSQKLEELL